MNNDDACALQDFELFSHRYSEVSTSGWMQEESDMNGQIEILDVVVVSGPCEKLWWVEER